MSVLGEMLGGTHPFEHDGKIYNVKAITQDVKVAFEKSLFFKAKDAALALRDLMDREQYAAHLDKMNNDYLSGKYRFDSKRGKSALQGNGLFVLLAMLFEVDEQTMMRIAKDKAQEVVALFRLITKESFGLTEDELKAGEEEWAKNKEERKKARVEGVAKKKVMM